MAQSKRRRSRGSGSIFKRKNGIYYYQYVDARGKKQAKSLRTKSFAEAKEIAKVYEKAVTATDQDEVLQQQAKLRGIIKAKALPLDETWDAFLKTNPTAGKGTLGNYKRHLEEFIDWFRKNYAKWDKFTDISDDIVVEYCQHLWQTGISANTYNYKRNSLGLITKALASKYGITSNKWTDSDLRKQEVKQHRLPLKCAEAENLLTLLDDLPANVPHPSEVRLLLKLCLYTGARLIDAVKMQWSSVNLKQSLIKYTPRKTASKGKEAEVPIMLPLKTDLEKIAEEQHSDQKYLFPSSAELYDRNRDGLQKPLVGLIQQVTNDEKNAATDAQVAQRMITRAKYGIHSLRATFATQAAMAGVKAIWLSKMLGDSLHTVDKYYLRAGYGDKILEGFETLPDLTEGTAQKNSDPKRQKAYELLDKLDGDKLDMFLKEYDS